MPEFFEKPKKINLGSALREAVGGQTQYLARYFDEKFPRMAGESRPFLGAGLRIQGDAGNYSEMTIHPDDAPEAIRRLREALGQGGGRDERQKENDDLMPPWTRE